MTDERVRHTLTITIPESLPDVETALVRDLVDGLVEYVHSEEIRNLYHARIALDTLIRYIEAHEKGPATYDGDGDILNFGRCVT